MLTLEQNPLNYPIAAPPKNMRPEKIAELAEANLHHEPYLVLRNVKCEYREGVLTLDGCLPSYHLKQVAQTAVASVPGVEHIDNQIKVVSTQQ
ncbi:MAG TPA: BON domain-containing protein [Gemmataceae bacterium]|nr:BON domain-containing protein [Gemmataceae bacterium]